MFSLEKRDFFVVDNYNLYKELFMIIYIYYYIKLKFNFN